MPEPEQRRDGHDGGEARVDAEVCLHSAASSGAGLAARRGAAGRRPAGRGRRGSDLRHRSRPRSGLDLIRATWHGRRERILSGDGAARTGMRGAAWSAGRCQRTAAEVTNQAAGAAA